MSCWYGPDIAQYGVQAPIPTTVLYVQRHALRHLIGIEYYPALTNQSHQHLQLIIKAHLLIKTD